MARPGSVAERGVRVSTVLEREVSAHAGFGRADILISMQVNLFVFVRVRQSLLNQQASTSETGKTVQINGSTSQL